MIRIVGLVSSYQEGPLLKAAVRSLAPLDHILVCEGPVDEREVTGRPTVLPDGLPQLTSYRGRWGSDAEKRTSMLKHAKALAKFRGDELWGLWLDGDEVLLWGEYLHDWLERVSQAGEPDNPVGGWPISLVELDGTVAWCMGKVVRLDLIRRYLASSSYIELVNGERRTVGNVEAWNRLNGPVQWTMERMPDGKLRRYPHWRARPPLQGEPHLLHRPILRDRDRTVERQHLAEARTFEGIDLEAEMDGGPDTPAAA